MRYFHYVSTIEGKIRSNDTHCVSVYSFRYGEKKIDVIQLKADGSDSLITFKILTIDMD